MAVVGASTLAYMIPISTVNEFLADSSSNVNTKVNTTFSEYINTKYNIINQNVIDNDYFSLTNFEKYGFDLQSIDFEIEHNLRIYSLFTKDTTTEILLNTSQTFNPI
jgi:uncharacterized protein YfkK (UPF0435 family)